MKTCLIYGLIAAIAQSFVILIEFLFGLHSDVAKLGTANAVSTVFGLAIGISCVFLCVRSRRDQTPASEDFGYGAALWAGTLQSFFASVIGAIFGYCYYSFINPGFSEVLLQQNMAKLQERGISGSQLDRMEAINRHVFTPFWLTAIALIMGIFFGFVISLVVAAIVKRPSAGAPPVIA